MPTIRATVSTTRAARYLAQLCSHAGHSGSAIPHQLTSEAISDTSGRIRLGEAWCDLAADAAALTLVVSAEDPEQARNVQTAVTRTLERIGRRDGLVVVWEEDERA